MPLPNATSANGSGRTKRINWSPGIQAKIRRLYLEEGVTLDKLPHRMRAFGFRASRRSYCSKLREWGWRRKNKSKSSDFNTRVTSDADPASIALRFEPLSKYAESAIAGQSVSPEPMFEEGDPARDLGNREVPPVNGTISSLEPEARAGSPQSDISMVDSCHSIAGLTCAVCFGCAISVATAVTESDSEWVDSQILSNSMGIF